MLKFSLFSEKVIGTTFSASSLAGFSNFYNQTMERLISNNPSYHENDKTVEVFKKFQDNEKMKELFTMDPSTEDKVFLLTLKPWGQGQVKSCCW